MIFHYVHGAGASHRSFNWLKERLPPHDAEFFCYGTDEPVASCVDRLVANIDGPCVLIGHSLGGIIATLAADSPHVEKLVTLCAPFGGVPHAHLVSLFSSQPLFHDLRPHGPVLVEARNKRLEIPHLAVVGTSGLPVMAEPNDGVVTVRSQTARPGATYAAYPLNHFEVLMEEDVASLISRWIQTD